jgi:hypothetical protein
MEYAALPVAIVGAGFIALGLARRAAIEDDKGG